MKASAKEIKRLKSRVEELQREVSERDEMIGFMSRRFRKGGGGGGRRVREGGGDPE
ncbi:hypothetical protein QJS10_CPB21g01182 [Acorus calamus]|uniref:Uncharacterized protein n=1 Tax=Acorus calamus TaxID=4465 RepID=A0AAV9C6G9_ACOCL|nr:hypothetical protein QJS10_CPB21g01182 [Acorus calamus]